MPVPPPPDITPAAYAARIASLLPHEYPQLCPPAPPPPPSSSSPANHSTPPHPIYLDHAATTPPSTTTLQRFTAAALADLHGNPHSASASGWKAREVVERARWAVKVWFGAHLGAGGDEFEVVFVPNASAGLRLVGEAFAAEHGDGGGGEGWDLGYWLGCHTSAVGMREMVGRGGVAECLESEAEVEAWIDRDAVGERQPANDGRPRLLVYPAQSNLDGTRLGLDWCRRVRKREKFRDDDRHARTYTLLDAAAQVSTAPLDLSDPCSAPDFTVLSLYKVFGFPDLGALIVRKDAAHVFDRRRYFGGGTVDLVVCAAGEQWHAVKTGPLHERLEDGTLPVHGILGLEAAMRTHGDLFGSMVLVSRHTGWLAQRLYEGLKGLRHGNGREVCRIYGREGVDYRDTARQGPIVALNFLDADGDWVGNAEVEKLASLRDVHLRTGGVCNPGGVAAALGLAPWEMRENFSMGFRCGSGNNVLNGKPTGVVRLSLGAMSTEADVTRFLAFVEEFLVDKDVDTHNGRAVSNHCEGSRHYIESLSVYPIKSCAGWNIPSGQSWDIRPEGLAWDREWCIVHQGTGKALSQKQHPKMALIRPQLDFNAGLLRIRVASAASSSPHEELCVPLSRDPHVFEPASNITDRLTSATVCGDAIETRTYTSPALAGFLTDFLGVPCTLARFHHFSASLSGANGSSHSVRHSKIHVNPRRRHRTEVADDNLHPPLLLSNESPILTITRASLDALNAEIRANHATKHSESQPPATIESLTFRPNIVLAPIAPASTTGLGIPWAEETWSAMHLLHTDTIGPSDPSSSREFPTSNPSSTNPLTHNPPATTITTTTAGTLTFLGSCTRCQMICIDQSTGERNAGREPFVSLAKMRRRQSVNGAGGGGGRVVFGLHTALDGGGGGGGRGVAVRVGQGVVVE